MSTGNLKEAFHVKTPKMRRQRIILEDKRKPEAPVLPESVFSLQQNLTTVYNTENKITTPWNLEELEFPFDFGVSKESLFYEYSSNMCTIDKAKEIFGQQLPDLAGYFSDRRGMLSYEHKVCILQNMFNTATVNYSGKSDPVSKFPAFLIYAKGIFPAAIMQEISVLCGKRLNALAMEQIKAAESSNDSLPGKLILEDVRKTNGDKGKSPKSPRKLLNIISPRSPRSMPHDASPNVTKESSSEEIPANRKPKRVNSFKNFFRDRLIDSPEPQVRSSADLTNLAPGRKKISRSQSDYPTPIDAVQRSASDTPDPNSSLTKASTKKIPLEEILQPLFDNQEIMNGDWSLVDPVEEKRDLKLLSRLWDHRYESGDYDSEDLASNMRIDSYWLDEPVFENNFFGKNAIHYISSDPDNIVVVSIACSNEKSAKMIIVNTFRVSNYCMVYIYW